MAQVGVQAGGDELVLGGFRVLHDVVEVGAGADHGDGAQGLAEGHEEEACDEQDGGEAGREEGVVGEQRFGEQALEEGGGVADDVGGAILGEQEGGDLGGARVVPGGGPELEVVEQRQRGEEEGRAP